MIDTIEFLPHSTDNDNYPDTIAEMFVNTLFTLLPEDGTTVMPVRQIYHAYEDYKTDREFAVENRYKNITDALLDLFEGDKPALSKNATCEIFTAAGAYDRLRAIFDDYKNNEAVTESGRHRIEQITKNAQTYAGMAHSGFGAFSAASPVETESSTNGGVPKKLPTTPVGRVVFGDRFPK